MVRSIFVIAGVMLIASLFAQVTAALGEGGAAAHNNGIVIFYRPNALKGAAIRFNIDHAGRPVGQLLSGTKIELPLPAGSHQFSVRSPSVDGRDEVTLNVEGGQKYYVEGSILWGWPAGRPKFTVMSESEAQPELARIK